MKHLSKNNKVSKIKASNKVRIAEMLNELNEDKQIRIYHLENKSFSGYFGGEVWVNMKLRITEHQIKRLLQFSNI